MESDHFGWCPVRTGRSPRRRAAPREEHASGALVIHQEQIRCIYRLPGGSDPVAIEHDFPSPVWGQCREDVGERLTGVVPSDPPRGGKGPVDEIVDVIDLAT